MARSAVEEALLLLLFMGLIVLSIAIIMSFGGGFLGWLGRVAGNALKFTRFIAQAL